VSLSLDRNISLDKRSLSKLGRHVLKLNTGQKNSRLNFCRYHSRRCRRRYKSCHPGPADKRVCQSSAVYLELRPIVTNLRVCYLWPWLGPPLAALQYVMYPRFCRWHHHEAIRNTVAQGQFQVKIFGGLALSLPFGLELQPLRPRACRDPPVIF